MSYELKDPSAPATPKQCWTLFCLTKKDYRNDNLTKQQASDMIGRLMAEKATKEWTESKKAPKKSGYEQILREATESANEAGDKWMAAALARGPAYMVKNDLTGEIVGTMLDVCGIVWIELTDRRTAFAKWLKKLDERDAMYSLRIEHKYWGRQEMGLLEACAYAAVGVLNKYGINEVQVVARID